MGSIHSKRKWLSKIALLTVAALATTSLCGLLAGCKGNSDTEDETEAKSNPDTQLLKNGNFEFYEDNDGDYVYYTPDNWSKTSTGTTSYTASGIINTAPDQWDRMTSLQTAVKLYVNDLLSTYNSDDDLSSRYSDTYDDYHVDYAGLKDYDLLYKDPATVIDVLDNLEDFADDDENTLSPSRFKELLGDGGENALQAVVDEYLLGTRGNYITDDNKDDVLPEDEDTIYIENPHTHDKVINKDEDGTYTYTDNNGKTNEVFQKTDEDDDDYDTKLYADEGCTVPLESSVLMIHNYLKNGNGTSQYYGASTTITLEANTAAKISVWVKTSDLFYHGYTPVKQNRGAYISVTQSVGSTSLDNFKINSINTEKINDYKPCEECENNGWVKYTVYVQACDYAETTVSINLGLGGTENGGVCEGYAFFDDVEVTKYKSMNALEESEKEYFENEDHTDEWKDIDGDEKWSLYDVITYETDAVGNKKFATKAENDKGNYVTLLNEGDEKIFYADSYKARIDGTADDDLGGEDEDYYEDPRYSDIFFYYIDLTSSSEKDYVTFNNDTLTMGATIETVDNKDYTYPNIFVTEDGELVYNDGKLTLDIDESNLVGNFSLTEYGELYEDLYVNENLTKIDISKDFLANIIIPDNIVSADDFAEYLVEKLGVASNYDYLNLLAENLYTATQLPNYSTSTDSSNNLTGASTVIMLSATGASYTADLQDDDLFTLGKDEYMIVSLWVKTSDTKSNTAATLSIMDADDEDANTSLTFQTTDVVTDIDEDEDIYNGWVQCFFYIHNDTDKEKTFKIRLQYGNTSISGTDLSSYTYGWAAFTNMQVLKITETEYDYTQTGTYAASFSFSDSDNRENSYFDDATKESDIKENITDASSYDGFNGGSSSVIMKDTMSNVDVKNSNDYAGLVNIDYFEDYLRKMLKLEDECDVWTALTHIDDLSQYDIDEDYEWLRQLLLSVDAYEYVSISTALTSAEDLWREIFGSTTVQPLLIVNCLRTYTSSKETELTEAQYTSGEYYVYISADDTEHYNTTASGDYYLQITSEEQYKDFLEAGYSFYTLEQALNYGFMGDTVTLSEDTYTAITVRVKVVGNAKAYIYLTETTKDRDVMSFEVPDYTFWYDDDGNVLITEPDEDDDKYDRLANIAYELRDDGLYEIYANKDKYDFDADGYTLSEDAWDYLYSNLNIYEIQYYDEKASYFNEYGEAVAWDDLDTDTKYYADESGSKYAPHYLVSTTGTRVFTYADEGVDDENGMNAVYYYYYYDEDEDTYTVSKENKVKSFDIYYATPRYTAEEFSEAVYMYEITEEDCQGDYVTVSFFIHTGNEEKSYKLELWSGERDSSGVSGLRTEEIGIDGDGGTITVVYPTTNLDTSGDSEEEYGYVIFDYSYIELDETTYSGLMSQYEDYIISQYQEAIKTNNPDLFSDVKPNQNIAYYENFIIENFENGEDIVEKIQKEVLYTALYYTFTLYDSAAYVPFNNETAQEDETGYAFTMSDYEETLAYFSYKDTDSKLYTTFIDYATVNQEIEVNRISSSEEEEEEESSTNAWILAASIVLVVALLATLVSMLVREIMKRHRINTSAKRNAKNRYIGGQRLVREQSGADGASPDIGGGAEM